MQKTLSVQLVNCPPDSHIIFALLYSLLSPCSVLRNRFKVLNIHQSTRFLFTPNSPHPHTVFDPLPHTIYIRDFKTTKEMGKTTIYPIEFNNRIYKWWFRGHTEILIIGQRQLLSLPSWEISTHSSMSTKHRGQKLLAGTSTRLHSGHTCSKIPKIKRLRHCSHSGLAVTLVHFLGTYHQNNVG